MNDTLKFNFAFVVDKYYSYKSNDRFLVFKNALKGTLKANY